jgi:hypothetical protein
LKGLAWLVGLPAGVVFAGVVAFFVAGELVPDLVTASEPLVPLAAAASEPEGSVGDRVSAECRKIVGDVSDLASVKALNDCQIELLTRKLSDTSKSRLDDAYSKAFK